MRLMGCNSCYYIHLKSISPFALSILSWTKMVVRGTWYMTTTDPTYTPRFCCV